MTWKEEMKRSSWVGVEKHMNLLHGALLKFLITCFGQILVPVLPQPGKPSHYCHTDLMPTLGPSQSGCRSSSDTPAAHSSWLEQHLALALAQEPFPEATQAVKAPSTMAWPLELGRAPQSCSCSCTCAGHRCRHWRAAGCLQLTGELQQGTDTALLLLLKDEFSSLRRRGWASGILLWEDLKISSQCSAHPSICASSECYSDRLAQPGSAPYAPRGDEKQAELSFHHRGFRKLLTNSASHTGSKCRLHLEERQHIFRI